MFAAIDNYENRFMIEIPDTMRELAPRRLKMLRVMIERKVKAGEDLSALLVELRVAADN